MQPKDVLTAIEYELGFLQGLSWALEEWAYEVVEKNLTEIRVKIEKMQEEYDAGAERMMQVLRGPEYMDCRVVCTPCNDMGTVEVGSKSPQSAAPTAPLTFKGSLGDTDCHVAGAPRNNSGVNTMWEEMREDGG